MKVLRSLLITARPRDWVKNGIVLAAWVDSGAALTVTAFFSCLTAFLLLSALASAIYLLNDVVDRERDKQHPTKRFRPIPSGSLPVSLGLTASVILFLVSIVCGWFISPLVGGFLTAYFVFQLMYVSYLKHEPYVELILISSGFVLRLLVATAVLKATPSPWLSISCFFTLMFMITQKRRYEISSLSDTASQYRPVLEFYSQKTLEEMVPVFIACAIVFYALYSVFNPLTPYLAFTIPFPVYGLLRYHHVAEQPGMDASGQRVFTLDRPTILNFLVWIALAIFLIAIQ